MAFQLLPRFIQDLRVLLPFLVAATTFAQTAAPTGSIVGRVYNPTTREFVRNAEVAIPGTNIVAYSSDDGSYRLSGVPAGGATVSVTYTGYERVCDRAGYTGRHGHPRF